MSAALRPAILVTALALIGAASAAAQPNAGPLVGLRLGGSISAISSDDIEFDSRVGLKAGASATFPVTGNLSLQTGVDYVEKGAKWAESALEEAVVIDYIEIPIMARYTLPVSGSITPRFAAGPAIALEVGCEFTAEVQGQSTSADCKDEGLDASSFDAGIMLGAGISYAVSGAMAVTLDILYNFGLTNIDSADDPVDSANRAWSLLLGVEFPILK